MLLLVEQVEQVSAEALVCVVRCLAGRVALGDTFDAVAVNGGKNVVVNPRVIELHRHEGVPVEFIDPPHSAKALMTGTGVGAVVSGARLCG